LFATIYTTKKTRKPWWFQFIPENSSHLTSNHYIDRTFIFVKLILIYKRISVDLNAEDYLDSSLVVSTSSDNVT